jgi:tetratricopeptide (TPR) repeat protein
MVTKSWAAAKEKKHYPLMVEIARTNMQRYWDKVTDTQSKASLLLMLGYSLIETGELEARKEGYKCNLKAMELIRSMGERSAEEIVYGVWPEACLSGWSKFLEQLDASKRNDQVEWIQEMMNMTRRTINSELERFADNADALKLLHFLSREHYRTELYAISILSVGFSLLSEEDIERWLAIFGKHIEEMETIYEREGWDLQEVTHVKASLLKSKCYLLERQGKVELALELARKALEKDENAITLNLLHAKLSLKTGRIEEAFKSLEKILLVFRSTGSKTAAAQQLDRYLSLVPEDSQLLFRELIPKYPHV